MTKLLIILLILTLTAFLPTKSFAQNSKSSSRPAPVDRNKLLNQLLKEAQASGELIEAMKAREAALDLEIKTADETNQRQTEAYKQALIEIGELRAKIEYEEKALAERAIQVTELRTEIAGLRGELKAARRRELLTLAKDVALTALMLFRH